VFVIIKKGEILGTKGVSQNHLLSFDDNKVLKLSIGYAKHLFKCTEGEKNHKKGGLNCVFENFFLNVLDNCPQVQSLK